jgi:hypothetical protein
MPIPPSRARSAEKPVPDDREARRLRRQTLPGPHGDETLHLPRDVLEPRFEALPAPPKEIGRVALIVSRRANEIRETPERVRLTPEGGVPGDAWARETPELVDAELAVMRGDVARLIANGQPLSLFGDNLLVELDLSRENLPAGTCLRAGTATLEVTPEPHDGCTKFADRFGRGALALTADRRLRHLQLRGIYMRVVGAGEVGVGDEIEVLKRPG